MGLSNSKDPLKNIYPQKIKGKNICFLQGWMGLFFLEQKETLLQISPVPHRSDFFNFLFQIVKWGNFAETLMYNTLCFTFASPEIQKNRVRPHCALVYSKLVYLLPISQQLVFSEADCSLLNFTRVDQELTEDPELDNDGYTQG